MKHTKKFVSLMLALLMVFAMTVTAFAEETTYKITINNTTVGHTYEAYQIFTGALSTNAEGKKVLSNIEWSANVTYTGTGVVVGKDEEGQDILSSKAADIAEALSEDTLTLEDLLEDLTLNSAFKTVASAKDATVIDGLPAGYYLVKDKDGSVVPEGEAYTKYIVQVAGDAEVNVKSGTTTSEKKVDDKNDSNNHEDQIIWQDSADHDIGDVIPFQLKAIIAEDYDSYEVYHLIFHDEESTGLTFMPDTVEVFVDGTKIESGYEVVTSDLEDDCTFEVRFADLKQITAVKAKSVITVTYKSRLNEDAVIGSAGNLNVMYAEYSNNPNDKQGGDKGTTPRDVVIVFTYQAVVNKVDTEGNPLTGAEFTLEKKILGDNPDTEEVETEYWAAIAVVKNDEGTVFTFNGLDDGDYRLTETETPEGYNSIDPIEFTITATHEIESDYPALTGITVNGGSFEIEMTEKETEEGKVEIPTGKIETDIVNKAGSVLPSTGGMGTTIFYILGGALVLVAVVLLVTKKRMKDSDKMIEE